MASKPYQNAPSPTPSSVFLPLGRRSRRGSLDTISSNSPMDREALSQALDQIHTSASQSETLTTFNEFAAPPSSSSATDNKGLAGDLVHGGLSGLYNRFRGAVGSNKDRPASRPASSEQASVDGSPLKSPRPISSSSKSGPGNDPALQTNAFSPAASTSTTPALLSPESRSRSDPLEQDPQFGSSQLSPTSSRFPLARRANDAAKPVKTPFGQLKSSTVADPTVAVINATAHKESDQRKPNWEVNDEDPTQDFKPNSILKDEAPDLTMETGKKPAPVKEAPAPSKPPGASHAVFEGAALSLKNESQDGQPVKHLKGLEGPQQEATMRGNQQQLDARDTTEPSMTVQDREIRAESVGQSVARTYADAASGAGRVNGYSIPPVNLPYSKDSSSLPADNSNSYAPPVPIPAARTVEAGNSAPLESRDNMEDTSQSRSRGVGASLGPPLDANIGSSRGTSISTSSGEGPEAERSIRAEDSSGDEAFPRASEENEPETRGSVLQQIRSRVLSKDFWMRDENCKVCFHCGDSFSTWRRKHHCRTCGQIFDAKCTSLVPGDRFGHVGNLRVCKPCKDIIIGYHDDSDDYESEDDNDIPTSLFHYQQSKGPRHALSSQDRAPPHSRDHSGGPISAPMMGIPATRRTADASSRRSAVLEINPEETLSRPGSSKSYKAPLIGMSPSAHKRHRSRHQLPRLLKGSGDDRAPFHQSASELSAGGSKLPVFHHDSIIDPDLAPYMSDDGSSEDEQPNILGTMNSDLPSSTGDNISNLLAVSRKSRTRLGDRSIGALSMAGGRDADFDSAGSSRAGIFQRPSRKRNTSFASTLQARPSLQTNRSFSRLKGISPGFSDSILGLGPSVQKGSPPGSSGSRMMRSASMKGASAPAVELNTASLQHVRKLLRQLLLDSAIPNVDGWEQAMLPILLQCTDDVNPDVRRGDDIDVRHYVKIKKVPGGRPADTSYVSGVVFSKNLALKSMPRSISHPRIMIITFSIEYQRHHQQFQSLEPVIAQEKEHLTNMVNRIMALNPQVLLVQKNISGLARQYLAEANIATAYNVKPAVLEAVARCSQADIMTSIDRLAVRPSRLGKSAGFDMKTFVHKDLPGKKKTFAYISGCSPDLGCTIVLRGADMETLSRLKKITEFMVYVVYNLKLETCLMRDEFVLIPSLAENDSVKRGSISHSTQDPPDSGDAAKGEEGSNAIDSASITEPTPDFNSEKASTRHQTSKTTQLEDTSVPDDIPMPTFYGDMVEKHQTKILSASPFVKFMQPYLLMRAREQERRLAYLKRLRDQDLPSEQAENEKTSPKEFYLIKPEMVQQSAKGAPKEVMEVLRAVHDAEYDKALDDYETQKRQWETYIAGNINLFDPFAHQNIAVLYTVVCTSTTIPCAGPDMLSLAFYDEHNTDPGFDADCTLGQYVEDLCLSADAVCSANGCEKKMIDHHRSYVHGESRVSVFVEKYKCKLSGLQDSILMWSYCKICKKETPITPMSESTWRYSFGKYLELSFWSKEMKLRAGICPHDLHRDHLRYFGFQDLALRIHHDPIELLEIVVPRPRITWKVENDLQLKNDIFTKTEERMNLFMNSVKSRIKGMTCDTVAPEKTESCRTEIERLAKLAEDEHIFLINKLHDKYMNSKHYEILPLNRAVRTMQEKVAEWDAAFTDFEKDFFPSEKDIRRLAALQLKRIFLDRDESVSSVASLEDGSTTPSTDLEGEKPTSNQMIEISPRPTQMSPEKAHNVLTSVVEEHSTGNNSATPSALEHEHESSEAADIHQDATSSATAETNSQMLSGENVRHLDLAMPSRLPENASTGTPNSSSSGLTTAPEGLERRTTEPKNSSVTPEALDPAVSERVEEMQAQSQESPITPTQTSGIPRPTGGFRRAPRLTTSPPLIRAQSQPAFLRSRKGSNGGQSNSATPPSAEPERSIDQITSQEDFEPQAVNEKGKTNDKKLSSRLGLSNLKTGKKGNGPSLIPRSIPSRKSQTRVSNLAKHFEQLSREFEKERLRERRHRAQSTRQSRAYPMASAKPIVEVYKNVHEAVEEREPSDDDTSNETRARTNTDNSDMTSSNHSDPTDVSGRSRYGQDNYPQESTAENTENEDGAHPASHVVSDAEYDASDIEHSLLEDFQNVEAMEGSQTLSPLDTPLDVKLELPKHERSSLMRMLTNFWAERSASGWTPLEYPLSAFNHVFLDSDVIVREDEPSSLIAFSLSSEDYKKKLASIRSKGGEKTSTDMGSGSDDQMDVENSLLRSTGTHLKYQFQDGPARMLCKVFYAEQFDAVQRKCGVADRIVESLSRCVKWYSKGGKTKSVFLKTLDERLVLKSLSPIETQAFLRFAPAYFQIMSKALFQGMLTSDQLPSVIAKMLGFYQIFIKNPVTGIEIKWDVLVMENLFYDRIPTRIFDLKGSMRNRKIQSTGEQNEVLLDENMVEFIYESPLFAREHSKNLLRNSVWNDTLFLAGQNVMDYSLMIAIDEARKELVVGIIDCIRTYTWDKKLESWIKARGFAGGNRNEPTVTSPKEYKSRFREAMARYVLQAPNCWHQFQALPFERRSMPTLTDKSAENGEGGNEVAIDVVTT
ncbi:MAG: hypothetical protein M4579_006801 [Chaenotheca gracillima]|nr:MAG: hypothetical protein M4579_006801 [Chaenotheca gracillima]